MPTGDPSARVSEQFYKVAMEYYASGRSAFLSNSVFVAGNLLHHAVEMMLKGHLLKTILPTDLAKRKFGHNLLILWTAFKATFPSNDLAEFDAMIDALNRFEEIRYPDKIIEHGVAIGMALGRNQPVTSLDPARAETTYQIAIGDVDALFARLFPLCRMNPKAYFLFLSEHGLQVLNEGNEESKNWLP